MSLTRSLFNEFRPFFRILEEPLTRPFPAVAPRFNRHVIDHPFWSESAWPRPAVDLSEEGNNYIVEAELPGVKKDNVEVRVGDGGRSITIEGKIVRGTAQPVAQEATTDAPVTNNTESVAVPSGESLHQISLVVLTRSPRAITNLDRKNLHGHLDLYSHCLAPASHR